MKLNLNYTTKLGKKVQKNLNWAIVEFAGAARRRGRRCSRLPQAHCNTADPV